jgi:hypothetical protein
MVGRLPRQRPALRRKEEGADTGIDGKVFFKPDGKRTEVAIVSVKSGGVSVNMIRELKSVIEREKAPMGLLLGPKILEIMDGDWPLAFGHRLILAVDAGNAGVALGLLCLAVDHPVVRRVLRQSPAAVPVGRVRQKVEAEP